MNENNFDYIILGDQISKDLEDRKRDLSILLLGHYKPRKMLKRLEELKDFLRSNGYSNTKLVRDIPDDKRYSDDNEEYFLLKSQINMQRAEIILFIFFKDGVKTGPEIELADLCSIFPYRCWRSAVIWEKGYKKNASAMLKGKIKVARMKTSFFNDYNDKQLHNAALGVLTDFSTKQYWRLKSNL